MNGNSFELEVNGIHHEIIESLNEDQSVGGWQIYEGGDLLFSIRNLGFDRVTLTLIDAIQRWYMAYEYGKNVGRSDAFADLRKLIAGPNAQEGE